VSLQQISEASDAGVAPILDNLTRLCKQQPPIADLHLLAFIYRLIADATRKSFATGTDPLTLSSAGEPSRQAWDSAAKAVTNRTNKLELWSSLFTCAMRHECWEDVRYVGTQYRVSSFCASTNLP
jgi:N-terminal acetyltransferase B complex non-catalytic subunit